MHAGDPNVYGHQQYSEQQYAGTVRVRVRVRVRVGVRLRAAICRHD